MASAFKLKVDNKKRVTLGKLVEQGVSSYAAEHKKDGTIVLHPYKEVPYEEAWLYENEEAMKSLKRGLRQAKKGELVLIDESFWEGD